MGQALGIKFRPYQLEALSHMVQATRGIIQHPTGSGKTLIAAAIAGFIGRQTLYVVPTIDLLNQTYDVFCKIFGEERIGKIGDGKEKYSEINIAVVNSLYNLLQSDRVMIEFQRTEVLIYDEAHHVSFGPNFLKLNIWLESALSINAYWRFGFTATPGKPGSPERRALEMAFGRVIHEYTYEDAVKEGYILQPQIHFYSYNHGDKTGKSWQESQKEMHLSPGRNKLIKDIAMRYKNRGKAVLVIVNRVDFHGRALEKLFNGQCKFIHGNVKSDIRKEALKSLEVDKDFVMISTVSGEGIDIPSLDVILRASGGKSKRRSIQELGRVVRIASGKKSALLVDIFDCDYAMKKGKKVDGYLTKHSRERKKAYESLNFLVEMK